MSFSRKEEYNLKFTESGSSSMHKLPSISKSNTRSEKVITRSPNSNFMRDMKYLEFISKKILGGIESSPKDIRDLFYLINDNEKLRKDIKNINRALNTVIEKKRAEHIKSSNIRKPPKKNPDEMKRLLSKMIINNEKQIKYLIKEDMIIDESVSKIRDVTYIKRLDEEVDKYQKKIATIEGENKLLVIDNKQRGQSLISISRKKPDKRISQLEDQMYLTNQLSKVNNSLRDEIIQAKKRIESTDEEYKKIIDTKEELIIKAKECNLIKSGLEKEHDTLQLALSKFKKKFSLTAKNFELEILAAEEELMRLRNSNTSLIEDIQAREQEIDHLVGLREEEMRVIKIRQEEKIKHMIKKLEQEIGKEKKRKESVKEHINITDSMIDIKIVPGDRNILDKAKKEDAQAQVEFEDLE